MKETIIDEAICREIAQKAFKNENVQILDWRFVECKDVIGFHGVHAKLEIDCQLRSGSFETIKVFYKGAIGRQTIFDNYWSTVRVFEREHYMFTLVLEKLESAVKVKLSPTFYKSELNRFTLTEDLNGSGYKGQGLPRTDQEHASLAVAKLAAFHAASFIIVQKTGLSLLDNFPGMDFEPICNPRKDESGVLMRTSCNHYRFLLKERLQDLAGDEVEQYLDWYADTIIRATRPSEKFNNCVLHGDPWGGNILYRYNENGTPTDALFVDFQLSRVAPPVVDLLMFLNLQLEVDQTRRLLGFLSSHYLTTLRNLLVSAGVSPDEFVTEVELRRSLMVYAPFAACIRAFYTLFVHLPLSILKKTLGTQELFLRFMAEGDFEAIKEAFDNFPTFRNQVTEALKDTFHYYKKRHLINM